MLQLYLLFFFPLFRKVPNLLEYYSYLFNFQGVLCGPFFHYSDYVEFVEGKNFMVNTKVSISS